MLDKGTVIVGDVRIHLLDIELLTVELRARLERLDADREAEELEAARHRKEPP
ncbi:gas vesicle protein GvpJ [Streptomyces chiangmaiensis]|uniref:Gas vesicle protein GvpJ n=1 Tax=Streptomyces chiangmaiensis TaxID=766497 RepID=A0ABU7FD44_9ACTN|nr:gas vesicle protein GvpJ [Streptomyces chiangmaiensis]MED7821983.1 gas vesicle protein GvpJ [Streptomyces chiangmaiensis]